MLPSASSRLWMFEWVFRAARAGDWRDRPAGERSSHDQGRRNGTVSSTRSLPFSSFTPHLDSWTSMFPSWLHERSIACRCSTQQPAALSKGVTKLDSRHSRSHIPSVSVQSEGLGVATFPQNPPSSTHSSILLCDNKSFKPRTCSRIT